MNKLVATRLLALSLLATTTQFIHSQNTQQKTSCDKPGAWQLIIGLFCWSQQETNAALIEEHLTGLEHDLIGKPHERLALVIPMAEIDLIKANSRIELKNLTNYGLKDKDYVDQILGSVMKQHVENRTRTVASLLTDNQNEIKNISEAVANSFATRLEHCPNRNGQALQEFFGTNLEEKVRAGLRNNFI